MTFLLISFIAGALTVLAPCILPLLPVVIGSSASGRSKATPYIVVASLGVSIILFTYLLKVSTAFISVPPEVWAYLSGGILFFFGLTLVFPALWERMPGLSRLSSSSNKLVGQGYQKKSFWGDVIIGASLGPVFSTCSPTYFVILASVLPARFLLGTIYLFSYTIGLSVVLLLIAVLGERFSSKLSGIADSHSKLKRAFGVLFILLGSAVAFGYDKQVEAALLNRGFDITKFEQRLLEAEDTMTTPSTTSPDLDHREEDSLGEMREGEDASASSTVGENDDAPQAPEPRVSSVVRAIHPGKKYTEIANPSGFVNTNDQPIKIADYVGKKVILLDVLTYSCINCQRTFPYITAWYNTYKDDGLMVIGIHTPEFAFEKDKKNVEEAMRRFGITFPVVLDNDYGTWNALGNRYWPHKYLIDIYGNVVYDHIGEGGYEETEEKIKALLEERNTALKEDKKLGEDLVASGIPEVDARPQSPETYFGSARNEYLVNGKVGVKGVQELTIPDTHIPNGLYVGGSWNFMPEYATGGEGSRVVYHYASKDVYLVADSSEGAEIEVWQDGKLVTTMRGEDVSQEGKALIGESRLYKIIHNTTQGQHDLELRIKKGTINFYTFTFG